MQSWEVFKVLALDVGMHLTEDDKKVLKIYRTRRVCTARFVSQLCKVFRAVLRAAVYVFFLLEPCSEKKHNRARFVYACHTR